MTLRNHRDFKRLWVGQAVSEIGSRITREGIPMGAVIMMGISPLTMSGLSLATQLPASLLGLFLGVFVDRLSRRPLMIGADITRAILLLAIPVATLAGVLHLWMFFVVAAISGVLSLLFDVAYQAYLPWLIDRDNLVEGNSKLGITSSFAEVVGPGLTGILVQLLTAPFAIAFDALSYLFSAYSLWRIGKREGTGQTEIGDKHAQPEAHREMQPGASSKDHSSEDDLSEDGLSGVSPQAGNDLGLGIVTKTTDWRQELVEGLRAVRSNRILLAFAGVAATLGLTSSAMFVLDTLYALRDLGLSPLIFGFTVTMGGVGSLLGAAVSTRVIRYLGVGRTLIITLFLHGFAATFWVMAGGSVLRATSFLLAAQLLGDTSGMVYGILETTVRQSLVSDQLLGRVNATLRVLDVGFTAVGSLTAGILGGVIGIRSTMAVAACGMMLTVLWLIVSPARKLRRMEDISTSASSGV